MNIYIVIGILLILSVNVWATMGSNKPNKILYTYNNNEKYIKYKNQPSTKKNIIKKKYQIIPYPEQSSKKKNIKDDWVQDWSSNKYILNYNKNKAIDPISLIQNPRSYNSYACNCDAMLLNKQHPKPTLTPHSNMNKIL